MRIVFDGTGVPDVPGLTGVGRWTSEIASALRAGEPDVGVELMKFGSGSKTYGDVPIRRVPGSSRRSRLELLFGIAPTIEHLVGGTDAFIGSAYQTWPTQRARMYPVVYDLSFIKHRSSVSRGNQFFLRKALPKMISRATRVITITHSVKLEVMEAFRLPDEKVIVVPGSGDHMKRVLPDAPNAAPGSSYFLFVGTLEPRKNIETLLRAHQLLNSRRDDVPPLLISGRRGWRDTSLRKILQQAEMNGRVMTKGFTTDEELAANYRHAVALVFPSLYEGFGLPVVEAMQSSCPVIAADIPAIREVAGDAAVLVPPTDAESIAAAMERVLDDDVHRKELIARGVQRAARYSWLKSAKILKAQIEADLRDG